ncbi:MAG: Crp/Fnr family transcriptional regulator [Thermonemataceae bacterium]|nr:Crp/Fnr family transcriptional regulator [Thermonemataceae bacterium]
MDEVQVFFRQSGFSEEIAVALSEKFIEKSFDKGDYFVLEGKTNTHLAYIAQGIFQYFYNKGGEEITSYIAMEGGFLASLASFMSQTPASENIRALTPAKLWMISKKNLDQLITQSEEFKSFYIQILEQQIVCIDKSRLDFIMLNAEERYEKMLCENVTLLQQVPLQLLASMLGVTPRHLSRIRNQIR